MNFWCGFMLALVAGTRTASAQRRPAGPAASSDPLYGTAPGSAFGTGAGAGTVAAEPAADADADDPAGASAALGRVPYELAA